MKKFREDFRVFLFYFAKYRKYYLIGIISLVIVDALEVVPPLLLKNAVDALEEKNFSAQVYLNLALLYMGVAIIQSFMRYLWRQYIVRTSMFASNDMRKDLFAHLSVLSPHFFKKNRIGELVSLSTNDTEAIRFALGPGALTFFDAMFYFLTIPPMMLYLSPKLTLISLAPMILLPFLTRRMETKIQKSFSIVQERFSNLAAYCQESLVGIRIIKGSALEPLKEKEFSDLGRNYIDANLNAAISQSSFSAMLEVFISICVTLLFLIGGALVVGEQLSIGVFVAFQRYIQKMSWPMEAIGLSANILQRSIASQKRIDKVMLEEVGILSAETMPPHLNESSSTPLIEIKNLTFKHPGANLPSLQNISLKIEPGMKVGLAGVVGSGKSTLLACIARMEQIPKNQIFFDATDVVDLPLSYIRKKIGFVPQEAFLFSRSIEDNILYGNDFFRSTEKSTREKIIKDSVKAANIEAEVEALPQKYQTLLGERGVNLSGGQKQRLTIARALARNPQVLLFDDCMSAIDSKTESKLIQFIDLAAENRTLIIASHRLSSLMNLDWVIVLDRGQIIEQGPPASLQQLQKILGNTQQQKLQEYELV